ncbi:hypothetical protein JXA48_02080 [Candidatus Woesearchaeota archaeon]|nr:hypothetical protein [Candidatus Woesearchaeota archaeon]
MISAVDSGSSPSFFILHYSSEDWVVKSLSLIPKFFVTHSMIEKRKPLSSTARRAGWTGCNFLLDKLPLEGNIPIVINEKIQDKTKVNALWNKMFFMNSKRPSFRGWTSDVLKVVQEQDSSFSLSDIYLYDSYFKELHPENNNIRAKIRQQLQILRDNKIIRFKGNGIYEKLK